MIDAEAVITRLRETDARSGGTREAWRDPWVVERERLDELARSISDRVTIERDAFANTWYVLPGEVSEAVLVGSHSDCVPQGGWLDGILGVHAGLGVLATIAAGPRPRRTLAVVDWADEEGTRFGRSLLGSSAATGALTASELAGLVEEDERPAADVVAPFGFDADALATADGPAARSAWRSPRLSQVAAACELHIEQGPRLERSGRSVAAVSGCLGVRRQQLTFTGVAGHAGSTPMAERRDPVRDAARMLASVSETAEANGGFATAGRIDADPAIATAIARRCRVWLDVRHAQLDGLLALEAEITRHLGESRCEAVRASLYRQDPVAFDPALVMLAASICGGDPVISGPLHDSAALARAGIPTVMLFCASRAGISHSRDEDTSEEDLMAGVQALHRLVAQLLDLPVGR